MSTALRLLAIDWGTSSLRGALLDADGQVVQQRTLARGIQTVAPGGFPEVFAASFGDWLAQARVPCLMAGMVGSRQGWVEAPYCACPAGLDDIAAQLTWLQDAFGGAPMAIVPGLCWEVPDASALGAGIPDVMRGEEVQVLGALRLAGLQRGCFVLPGTHSKWVWVEDGRIRHWRTFMTGEIFALLSRQSILARTLPQEDTGFDAAAFAQGLAQSRNGLGLLHNAFGVRTLSLFERLAPQARRSYLSGLLVGDEVRVQSLAGIEQVQLIGDASLTRAYAQALAAHGVRTRSFGAEASWRGLQAIAERVPGLAHSG